MTPAIMLSFVIPAIVAVTLTVLLVKERDYLFNRKNTSKTRNHVPVREDTTSEKRRDHNHNEHGHIDYSGGLMGL